MMTLELRNLYAKKISKSLNKVLEQIDLLNNIDNNIILNNNFVGSESKIYNNNLYGGADSKTQMNDPDCDQSPFIDMTAKLNDSLTTYSTIETNIQKLLNKYQAQIQAKDIDIAQHQQQIAELTNNSQNMVSREEFNKTKQQCIDKVKSLQNERKQAKDEMINFRNALKKCNDCKATYMQKLNEMKTYVDTNNTAVSNLLTKVQDQLEGK